MTASRSQSWKGSQGGMWGRVEGTHVLGDVSPVPIRKLQGIALRVRQAPPAGSRGSVRQAGGALPLLPRPIPYSSRPAWTRTHASHTSFSTAARGFAYKWKSQLTGWEWEQVAEEPGVGRGGLFEGKGATRRKVVGWMEASQAW